MNLSRRNFLKKSGIVTSGLMFSSLTTRDSKGLTSFVHDNLQRQNLGIELDKVDLTILNCITKFCEEVYFQGGCILGKLLKGNIKSTCIVSKVDNFSTLKDFLFKQGVTPLSSVYNRANVINFYYGETFFSLENLSPEVFACRIMDYSTVQDISYAHQALLYDPIKHKLWDPFSAINIQDKIHQSLNLVQIKSNLAQGFKDIIQGELDMIYFKLSPGLEFTEYKNQFLEKSSIPLNLSKNIVSIFVNNISVLAKYINEETLFQYVTSPIISSSIEAGLGLKAHQVVQTYKQLSKNLSSKYSSGAIWLALLFSPKINEKNRVDVQQRILDHGINFANFWIQHDDRFNFIQSQDDFAMSRAVVADSAFKSIVEDQLS